MNKKGPHSKAQHSTAQQRWGHTGLEVEDDKLRGAGVADVRELVDVHDVHAVHAVHAPKLAVVPERNVRR